MCVYVVYEDRNVFNDMGMTLVLQGEGDLRTFSVPIIQNAYKSYRVSFCWGKVEMHHLL